MPSPEVLAALDQWASHPTIPFRSIRHDAVVCARRGADLIAILKALPDALGLAAVLSFSWDGYVREQAVRNLAALGERGLPYIALRTEDWVEPVRGLAMTAFSRVHVCSDEALASCLATLVVVMSHALRQEIQARDGFLDHWRFRVDPVATSTLLREELLGPGESWADVLAQALESPHQRVGQAAIQPINLLAQDEQAVFLEALSGCRNRAGRCLAMKVADSQNRVDVLNRGVFDRNWRVRNDARFYLKKRGPGGFTDCYRQAFPSWVAIEGFGEVASEADLAELLVYAQHPRAGVRQAVLRALVQRKAATPPQLKTALTDSSASVVRLAIEGLDSLGVRMTLDELEALLSCRAETKNQKGLERATRLLSWWDQFELMLRRAHSGALMHDLPSLVRTWFSDPMRHTARPAAGQLDVIEPLVSALASELPEHVLRKVREEITFARRLETTPPGSERGTTAS